MVRIHPLPGKKGTSKRLPTSKRLQKIMTVMDVHQNRANNQMAPVFLFTVVFFGVCDFNLAKLS